MTSLLTIWATLVLTSYGLPNFQALASSPASPSASDQFVAMFSGYSDEALVSNSDVIIQGQLIGATQVDFADGSYQDVGILRIDAVLKGSTDNAFFLMGLPDSMGMQSSNSITYRKNQEGLWFLRSKTRSGVTLHWADHPQRLTSGTISDSELSRIRALIP